MNDRSHTFLIADEIETAYPAPGVARKVLGYDRTLMTVAVTFEANAVGAVHAHPHAQTTCVVSGRFEVSIGTRTRTLRAGDGYYVAPHEPHGCICREAGTLIDSFAPCRQDFLEP